MCVCVCVTLSDGRTDSPTACHAHLKSHPRSSDWVDLICSFLCVLCAALASGLTIGLMVRTYACLHVCVYACVRRAPRTGPTALPRSTRYTTQKKSTHTKQSIDQLELEIKQRVGTPDEQKYAKALLPILNRRHLLLVTLLLFNASAAESLPLFLGAFCFISCVRRWARPFVEYTRPSVRRPRPTHPSHNHTTRSHAIKTDSLVPEYVAIIVSVTAVLFAGEIIPSAIFSGPSVGTNFQDACPVAWILGVGVCSCGSVHSMYVYISPTTPTHHPRQKTTRAEPAQDRLAHVPAGLDAHRRLLPHRVPDLQGT